MARPQVRRRFFLTVLLALAVVVPEDARAQSDDEDPYCMREPDRRRLVKRCHELWLAEVPESYSALDSRVEEWLETCTQGGRAPRLLEADTTLERNHAQFNQSFRRKVGPLAATVYPAFRFSRYRKRTSEGTERCYRVDSVGFFLDPQHCQGTSLTDFASQCAAFPFSSRPASASSFRGQLWTRLESGCTSPTNARDMTHGSDAPDATWRKLQTVTAEQFSVIPIYDDWESQPYKEGARCYQPRSVSRYDLSFPDFPGDVIEGDAMPLPEFKKRAKKLIKKAEVTGTTTCIVEALGNANFDATYYEVAPIGIDLNPEDLQIEGTCWQNSQNRDKPPDRALRDCRRNYLDRVAGISEDATDQRIINFLEARESEIERGVDLLRILRTADQGALWSPATSALCRTVQSLWEDGGIYACVMGKAPDSLSCR